MPIINHQELTKKEGDSPGLEGFMLADEERGSESLRIGDLTIAPNARVPRHIHPNTEEAMIVLEGTLDVILGSERATVGAGHTILAPAGVNHGIINRYDKPARMLCVFPTHQVERVVRSAPREKFGFTYPAGLTAHTSSHDRPLDKG